MVAFVFAASWFLPKRAWLAKVLSLGAWFILGAFVIQIRGQEMNESHDAARILGLADGRRVILTARVMREGYAREAGPKSVRESIDVETETVASGGETWPIRAGVRLTVYEKTGEDRVIGQSGDRVVLDDPMARSPDDPILTTVLGCAFLRSCIRRAITGIREPSITKAICATTASARWGRRRRRIWSSSQGSRAVALNSGERACMPAWWPRFTSCGQRRRHRLWMRWFSAKNRFCATRHAWSISARGLITCWLSPE